MDLHLLVTIGKLGLSESFSNMQRLKTFVLTGKEFQRQSECNCNCILKIEIKLFLKNAPLQYFLAH